MTPSPSPLLFKKVTSLSDTDKIQSIPADQFRNELVYESCQDGIVGRFRVEQEKVGRRVIARTRTGKSYAK